jgi:hypothetical protein
VSDLRSFGAYCAAMATADHKPDCDGARPTPPQRVPIIDTEGRWAGWRQNPARPPTCPGCVSDLDRARWALLAAEVHDYLSPQPDLFGELTQETA